MIFGIGNPKFTGTGDPDSNTIDLPYAILVFEDAEIDVKELKSILTGVKKYDIGGDYTNFRIIYNLFKHTSGAITKYNTLMSYNHKDVIFYPHKDGVVASDGLGKSIKDASNNTVSHHIKYIKHWELDGPECKDMLEIYFTANKYVDLTKTTQ